jgi:RsiW-degrading membrane proteinase PrsW (M82 family)
MEKTSEAKPRQGIWPTIPWKPIDDGTSMGFFKTLLTAPSAWGMHTLFIIELIQLVLARRHMFLFGYKTISTSAVTIIVFALTYIWILIFAFFLYYRSQNSEYQCSPATIFRWFFFSMFCMEIFDSGMLIGGSKFPEPIGLLLILVPFALSMFFAILPGTFYERAMRFFGFNPAAINGAEPYSLGRLEQLIWGFRVLTFAFVLGFTNGLVQKTWIPDGSIETADTAAKFIIAFLGAGFHEESFKILLLGTMTLIPKWKRKPGAIIIPGILGSIGFAFLEMPQYLLKMEALSDGNGWAAIFGGVMRGICIILHALFTLPVAVSVSRQKGKYSPQWVLEIFAAYLFSIFSHGLYDVLLFLGGVVSLISSFFLIFGTLPLAFYLVQKFLPPSTSEESLQ